MSLFDFFSRKFARLFFSFSHCFFLYVFVFWLSTCIFSICLSPFGFPYFCVSFLFSFFLLYLFLSFLLTLFLPFFFFLSFFLVSSVWQYIRPLTTCFQCYAAALFYDDCHQNFPTVSFCSVPLSFRWFPNKCLLSEKKCWTSFVLMSVSG